MKKIFTTMYIALSVFAANSQTFTLSPGNVDTVDAPMNTLTIFDIYPINITSSPILFKWTKVSMSLPSGWDYALCDYGHCYTGLPSNGTMDTVDAGDPGLLGLNINPYSTTGQGIVKLYVYDAAFPSDGDTITWVVNANMVSVNETNNPWNALSLYPNPAADAITLSNIPASCNIAVMDMTGKLVEQHAVNATMKTIDVSAYNKGLYTIVVTEQGQISARKKFVVVK